MQSMEPVDYIKLASQLEAQELEVFGSLTSVNHLIKVHQIANINLWNPNRTCYEPIIIVILCRPPIGRAVNC